MKLEFFEWTHDDPRYQAMGARYIDRETGNYVTWESDTSGGTVVSWSSDATLPDIVTAYQGFSNERFLPDEDGSTIRVPCDAEVKRTLEAITGEYDILSKKTMTLDMPTEEAVEIIEARKVPVLMASLGFRATHLAWAQPYVRFVDSDTPKAEINAGGQPLNPTSILAIGNLLRATTNIDPLQQLDNISIKLYRHKVVEEVIL